ncbi:DUF6279 family lipoprotein [Thauera butanivorans]|jgi:hypothetical protein|uniref:DUF6279 family lipoprotein n=1 Tax=Thauera butanivorans TaxID=86174 RepID=UPI000B1ED702|nr:DUF6279 family lipoprotein [Thauera butanivorans]
MPPPGQPRFRLGRVRTARPAVSACARSFVAVLLAVLVLGGCGVRFAYSQLDWLVPWYLRDYVTFDAGQRQVLDQRLALRLDWHCRVHLPGYVGLLRDARRLLARERIEAQELAPFLRQGEAWWDELRVELMNDAKVLLAGLSDDQVAELAAAFERRDKEAREEFLGGSTEARRKAQIARMEKRLRNWFGRLTDEQRALVAGWSQGLQPTTERWLDERRQWQQGMLEALKVRREPRLFAERIAALQAPAGEVQDEYSEQAAHNRQRTLDLLAGVFNTANDRQRERLLAEIDGLTGQFDKLACAAPKMAETGRGLE